MAILMYYIAPTKQNTSVHVFASVVLLIAALSSTQAAAAPDSNCTREATEAPEDGLWRWLGSGGAHVNFDAGFSSEGVRGGYASRDIPAGGVVSCCSC
jgi:hypothetical protein